MTKAKHPDDVKKKGDNQPPIDIKVKNNTSKDINDGEILPMPKR